MPLALALQALVVLAGHRDTVAQNRTAIVLKLNLLSVNISKTMHLLVDSGCKGFCYDAHDAGC
jgi:uncharacterized membrane protein